MQINSQEERRSVFQGHRLVTYTFIPTVEIKALLCVCHGVHEYMGPFERLGNHLKDQGVLLYGMDMVGHGRSEGVRGHIDSIESYATDMIGLIEDMRVKYPSIPTFLMGHSMGGLVATMVAVQRQDILKGLLLSAPAILLDNVGVVKMGVFDFDESQITSLPNELELLLNDSLITWQPCKASWCAAMISAVEIYQDKLKELTLPLLALHGTADLVIPVAASELAYANVSSTDKRIELFVDSFHKTLSDREQERVQDVISNWILERT